LGLSLLGIAAVPSVAGADVETRQSSVLDRSFGQDGISLTHPTGFVNGEAALALASDRQGRLLITGTTEAEKLLLRRYLPNGAPDSSLDHNGKVETSLGGTSGRAITTAQGGGILVAGGTDGGLALVRYRSDGSRQRSFGHNGHVVVPGSLEGSSALAVDTDARGRIFSGGFKISEITKDSTAMVIGYRSDGSLNSSFGDAGMVQFRAKHRLPAAITGIEVLRDGKILVGGDFGGRLMLARLLPSGKLDPAFGDGDGKVLVDADGARRCVCSFVNSLTITPDGKVLLAGLTTAPGRENALLARFLPDGRLDRGFGRHGLVQTSRGLRLVVNDATVQRDGRITAVGFFNSPRAGEAHLAVLRYLPNGRLDHSFAAGGFFQRHLGRESIASAAITLHDGRVVVAGRAAFGSPAAESPEAIEGSQVLMLRFRR
jgi:uncharacterized delta-60 repeat protein